jgi:uncharacterized OB-fold protein
LPSMSTISSKSQTSKDDLSSNSGIQCSDCGHLNGQMQRHCDNCGTLLTGDNS